jgi:hypothetical protein
LCSVSGLRAKTRARATHYPVRHRPWTALAASPDLPSLLAALRDRERSRAQLEEQVESLDGLREVSLADVGRLERDLRACQELAWVLRRQVPISRQIVSKLLGEHRVVFTPREDDSWTFTGRATWGKLLQGIVLQSVWRPHRDSNPGLGLERAAS